MKLRVDEIFENLDSEESSLLMELLSTRSETGDFKYGARTIAKIISNNSPFKVGKTAVTKWRAINLEVLEKTC